jgi:hypothetical protein
MNINLRCTEIQVESSDLSLFGRSACAVEFMVPRAGVTFVNSGPAFLFLLLSFFA